MSIAHPPVLQQTSPAPLAASAPQSRRPFRLIGELINHSFARAARAWEGRDVAGYQRLAKLQPLVIAAAGPVHDQDRRAVTGERILNRAAGRLDDVAAGRDALACVMQIASICGVGQPDESGQKEPHHKRDGTTHTYSGHS